MRYSPALLPVFLLAVCGCGSGSSGGDAAAGRPATGKPSPPAASAGPSKSALPEAADGSSLKSCADAKCEVAVERGDKIRLRAPVGVAVLRVAKVAGGKVDLVGTGPGIQLGWKGGAPGKSFRMNRLKIKLVAAAGDRAVLRLARG
jgi:hypothetical protein